MMVRIWKYKKKAPNVSKIQVYIIAKLKFGGKSQCVVIKRKSLMENEIGMI